MTSIVLDEGMWRVDRSRSAIRFLIRHFGVATVGQFESFGGLLEARNGELRVAAYVHPATVATGNSIRDARLRSEFFDAARYPESRLRADGSERMPRGIPRAGCAPTARNAAACWESSRSAASRIRSSSG